MMFGFRPQKKRTRPALPVGGLIDGATAIILAVTPHTYAIRYLIDADPGAALISSFRPSDPKEPFPLASADPATCTQWTWDWKKRRLLRADPAAITPLIEERSRMARARLDAIVRITRNINRARTPIETGLHLQETVYMTKKFQAQTFKDSGYDDARALEFPYVLQYADFAGVSLKEAADRIILKAKFDDQVLAKTELLRMKYFDKVRRAQEPEELAKVYEEFLLEYYRNAMV